ncbi:hypothetical protein D3C84_878870 [compost metagenome]
MSCAIDGEQLLVLCTGGLGKGLLRHIQAVRLAARDHQQRLVDQFDLIRRIEAHQVQQAAQGVPEGRVGVSMSLAVVLKTLPIQIKWQPGDLLVGEFGIAGVENFSACRFLGTGSRSLP